MSTLPACPTCLKPATICVCDRIAAISPPLQTRARVLVLQHPQEPDIDLGTARLLELMLPAAQVVVGLSWGSLSQALGEEADPRRWGVLYPASLPRELTEADKAAPVVVMNPVGGPVTEPLDGIVVLDGTWSQGKAIWWRNPWFLKLQRVVLHPREPSIYGQMRKEPRREALSTLEAVAEVLQAWGEPPAVRVELRKVMRTMIQRARDTNLRGVVRPEGEAPRPRRR